MKIAIVNDVSAIGHLLTKIISEHSNHSVIWSAENGRIAVEKAQMDKPDMILMDLIMPVMNGVDATRQIMQTSACAILVVTASVNENADMVFKAMSAGALDAISTPNLNLLSKNSDVDAFLGKLKIVERLITNTEILKQSQTLRINKKTPEQTLPMICIGSSTGGPGALAKLISRMPGSINATFIAIQHVDKNFIDGLADWLNQQTDLCVQVAKKDMIPEAGHLYIAGGDEHLSIDPAGKFILQMEPVNYIYRPSIDVCFDSIAKYWPGKIIAALLTGMGSDGAKGLLSLLHNGAYTIAQDEESCSVFGMPKAAINLNAANIVLPISEISDHILDYINNSKMFTQNRQDNHGST